MTGKMVIGDDRWSRYTTLVILVASRLSMFERKVGMDKLIIKREAFATLPEV